jgi:hypothetical protein
VRTRIGGRAAAALTAGGALLLTGACGGHGNAQDLPPSPYASSPSASPTPTAKYGLSPLTGIPARSRAEAGRAAFGVALTGSDPQGLTGADLVYEEESDPARYIAVYQSGSSAKIGPLGQGRSTDPQLMGALHAGLGYATMRPGPHSQLSGMHVTDLGYPGHPSAYTGGGAYTSTKGMYAAIAKLHRGPGQPPSPFTYVAEGRPLASKGLKKATKLRVSMPGSATRTWTYSGGRWRPSGGGPKVPVANVIVQRTEYKTTNIAKGGVKAPKAKVFGTGTCVVASAGQSANGKWNRQSPDSMTLFVDSESFPFRLAPGPTWVILAPPGTSVRATP